jgi:hypothetical protein
MPQIQKANQKIQNKAFAINLPPTSKDTIHMLYKRGYLKNTVYKTLHPLTEAAMLTTIPGAAERAALRSMNSLSKSRTAQAHLPASQH